MSVASPFKRSLLTYLPFLPPPLLDIVIVYMRLSPSGLIDVISFPLPPALEEKNFQPVTHRSEKCTTQEIVHISLGQGGNRIARTFWENLCAEHRLEISEKFTSTSLASAAAADAHMKRVKVYFNEDEKHYVPRAVLADLDPESLQQMQQHTGHLYRAENFVHGYRGTGSNWAKGFYHEGAALVENILEAVRRETERAECLQGFQLSHTLGGGTGSGLGSLLLSRLGDDYENRMTLTFSIAHSQQIPDQFGYLNTLMGLHHLIENSVQTVLFDNEALHDICRRTLKIPSPSLQDCNSLLAGAMSAVTSPFRFPAERCYDLRTLATQLVAFPRLHFYMASYWPLAFGLFPARSNKPLNRSRTLSIAELNQQTMDAKNMLCDADPRHGRYTSVSTIFRGEHIARKEVDEQLYNVCNKNSSYYVEWIPNNQCVVICNVPNVYTPASACLLGNSTAMHEVFQRIEKETSELLRNKRNLHQYMSEGMEEVDFDEAQMNISDMISEYLQYQNATAFDDEDF